MTSDAATTSPEERLRSAGLKVTAPRLAVLDVVQRPGHRSAEDIFGAIGSTLPNSSMQAVYGVLAALEGAGLLRKIEPAGSPALYENRIGDNHHHLVCTSCQAVQDVDCVIGEAPCLTPHSTHGFEIQTAEVTFWGLCADCQAARASADIEAETEAGAEAR
ncbi:Fur family ferric uptake transcriptional regulator [Microterricola gilva]|uniref:Fur family ferric uptake transcriptional regulator n=1 Tax=Microterricola gilva TaxID=393267 RepID=A0A4Q8AHI2_9MICO|nr:Fur family transcriptional regulator [Microterricola gilva]RZU63857.1 Fur family ferric uptake transcriptional regulator [Microterricola gilva]